METQKALPEGWRWAKLGEVIREARAGFACGEREADGIVQLRMNNLDTRGNFLLGEVIRVPRSLSNLERFLLSPSDVLFNNTNSTELVGKSALFCGHSEPIVYSNHFTRLRTSSEDLLPDVLASWLNHQWQQGVFASICNRWIGQSAVKTGKLLSLEIPLPPLPEQKRIAAILKDQMAATEKARTASLERVEAVRALPSAWLREVFSFGGGGLPQGWRWERFGNLCRIRTGKKNVNSGSPNGKYPFFTCATKHTFSDEYSFDTDALLIAGNGNVGEVQHYRGKFEAYQRTYVVDDFQHTFPEYAFYALKNGLKEFVSRQKLGNTMPYIKLGMLQSFRIALPPHAEQKRLVSALNSKMAATEKIRASAEAELEAINALPAALLRRAFNGEI